MAFRHEFLMRGILALSAIHLAKTNPDRSKVHEAEAMEHHSIALGLYRPAMSCVVKGFGTPASTSCRLSLIVYLRQYIPSPDLWRRNDRC